MTESGHEFHQLHELQFLDAHSPQIQGGTQISEGGPCNFNLRSDRIGGENRATRISPIARIVSRRGRRTNRRTTAGKSEFRTRGRVRLRPGRARSP